MTRDLATRAASRAGTGTSAGETLYANDCDRGAAVMAEREAGSDLPRDELRERTRTSSEHPAIENNGDLKGGHLGHGGNGPYPGTTRTKKDWGDIIPPFDYIDENGKPAVSKGVNWTPEGQAIYQNGCNRRSRRSRTSRSRRSSSAWRTWAREVPRHFGYNNPNDGTVDAAGRSELLHAGAPTGSSRRRSAPGASQMCSRPSSGETLTWSLTGNELTGHREARQPLPRGVDHGLQAARPADDTGSFALRINGEVKGGAAAVGDGGTTGTIAVHTGRHTVSETGAPGTSLADYTIEIVCRTGRPETSSPARTVRRSRSAVAPGRRRSCARSRTRPRRQATGGPAGLECVVFNDGEPDVAVWGYENGAAARGHDRGSERRRTASRPTPADRRPARSVRARAARRGLPAPSSRPVAATSSGT